MGKPNQRCQHDPGTIQQLGMSTKASTMSFTLDSKHGGLLTGTHERKRVQKQHKTFWKLK